MICWFEVRLKTVGVLREPAHSAQSVCCPTPFKNQAGHENCSQCGWEGRSGSASLSGNERGR